MNFIGRRKPVNYTGVVGTRKVRVIRNYFNANEGGNVLDGTVMVLPAARAMQLLDRGLVELIEESPAVDLVEEPKKANPVVAKLKCPECDRDDFASAKALIAHQSRSHGWQSKGVTKDAKE